MIGGGKNEKKKIKWAQGKKDDPDSMGWHRTKKPGVPFNPDTKAPPSRGGRNKELSCLGGRKTTNRKAGGLRQRLPNARPRRGRAGGIELGHQTCSKELLRWGESKSSASIAGYRRKMVRLEPGSE